MTTHPPDDLMAALERSLRDHRQRIDTVHERIACPKCQAPCGVRCWRAGSRRPGVELKHPHAERLRADGTPDR